MYQTSRHKRLGKPQFVRKTSFARNSTTEAIRVSTASMGGWHAGHGVMFLVGFSQDNRALMDAWRLAPPIDRRKEVTEPPNPRLALPPCMRQSINP